MSGLASFCECNDDGIELVVYGLWVVAKYLGSHEYDTLGVCNSNNCCIFISMEMTVIVLVTVRSIQ
jgi:hypothetical protein